MLATHKGLYNLSAHYLKDILPYKPVEASKSERAPFHSSTTFRGVCSVDAREGRLVPVLHVHLSVSLFRTIRLLLQITPIFLQCHSQIFRVETESREDLSVKGSVIKIKVEVENENKDRAKIEFKSLKTSLKSLKTTLKYRFELLTSKDCKLEECTETRSTIREPCKKTYVQ